jgi:hypothetical protein
MSIRIERTEAQRLDNLSFRLFGATDKDLAKPDAAVSVYKISIYVSACSHLAIPCAARLVSIST